MDTFELVNLIFVPVHRIYLFSGYIRTTEQQWNTDNMYYQIPQIIQHLCLTYYHILYFPITYDRVIDDWFIGETIGGSVHGHCKIKTGIHRTTGENVALKIMLQDKFRKKTKLMKEINLMKKIKHKNVLRLLSYNNDTIYPQQNGDSTKCFVYVLELAGIGDLFDFLMYTGHFDESATRTCFHQILSGLDAIHKLGICHRDLTLEHVLLDENYVLKITGFHFATSFLNDDATPHKMTTACGTKGYLSPEMLHGMKYTYKCDIFSVGIILFIMYAGFPPFQNAIRNDWWWHKLNKGWEYRNTANMKGNIDTQKYIASAEAKFGLFWKAHERQRRFNSKLKDLIEKILNPKPEYRFDIKDIKQHEWYMLNVENKIYNNHEMKTYLRQRMETISKERMKKINRLDKDSI